MEASPSPKVRAAGVAGRVKKWAAAHKWWSALIIILVLYGGYRIYAAETAPSTAPKYVTTNVASSTVIATITETGQVSASQQLALTPQASAQVVGVYVTPGEHVGAGQVIAQLDATNAEQSLENAKLSLQNEQLSYQQTTASSTLALNLLEAENGVTNAQVALQKEHDSAYASLTSVYTDLSATITDLNDDLYDFNVSGRSTEQNVSAYTDLVSAHDAEITVFENSAETSYSAAITAYDTALTDYKATDLSSSDDAIVTLAGQTYTAVEAVAEAVKDAHDFFDRVSTDYTLYDLKSDSTLTGLLSATNSDQGTVSADLSDSLSVTSDILSAEQAVAQAQNTLQSVQGGSNALTVQQASLSLEQAEQALTTAEQNLADYTVTAPFSGTIVSVPVQKYDQASSGTTVATIVTDNQTVDISVNEVDAAKLQVGQKATLTFDALPGVSIAGTVSEINTLGAVSSGVVSYSAVITFDTPNPSVLPGMSASAEIITSTASGLVVPASAVHTQNGASYVEVFDPPLSASGEATNQVPKDVPVATGLASATSVIITSGLTPGEQVVVSTSGASATTKTAAASATSAFGGTTRAGGGGNATFRAGGGL